MVRRSIFPGACRWRTRLTAVPATALMVCLAGCPLTSASNTGPPADPWQELATSVTVAAEPARRWLVTADENQSGSRLLVVWVRVESAGNEVVAFTPDNVALVFADGTTGVTLDRDRADILIERLEVAPTDEAVANYPDLWTIARRPDQQRNLKQQLRDGLLAERPLAAETAEGYLIFDTRQRTSSLDGASLQIILVRNSDGAKLRQVYPFARVSEPVQRTQQE